MGICQEKSLVVALQRAVRPLVSMRLLRTQVGPDLAWTVSTRGLSSPIGADPHANHESVASGGD